MLLYIFDVPQMGKHNSSLPPHITRLSCHPRLSARNIAAHMWKWSRIRKISRHQIDDTNSNVADKQWQATSSATTWPNHNHYLLWVSSVEYKMCDIHAIINERVLRSASTCLQNMKSDLFWVRWVRSARRIVVCIRATGESSNIWM